MVKIAIDAGHGKYTSGKRCLKSIDPNETREWYLNSRIAEKIVNRLNQYKDVEIIRLDDVMGEIDVPLINRTNKANKWGADWVFSIHHNAGVGGGAGGGIVVFTYLKPNAKEVKMQKAIYNYCMERGGLSGRSQPMAKQNFHMVREPKGNAILIEYGFMDSTTDTPIILTENFADSMAEATVKAIAEQLNLKEGEREMTEKEVKTMIDKAIKEVEKKIYSKNEKVYHYWTELPKWAEAPLMAMYNKGLFSGASANDLNINQTKLECVVIIARALKEQGFIEY